jgi:hypothetical protein
LAANRPGNGPYSKLLARGVVSGRSRNGRFLAAAREEIMACLGDEPLSTEKRILVDRVAWLMLYVALFDERAPNGRRAMAKHNRKPYQALGGRVMTVHDRRTYLAFSNALVRAMRALGLTPCDDPIEIVDPMAVLRAHFDKAHGGEAA